MKYLSNLVFSSNMNFLIAILKLLAYFQISYCMIDASKGLRFTNNDNVDKTEDNKNNAPIIETNLGKIQGKNELTRDGRDVLAFLGVPYAVPPIGDLRFKVTEEIKAWEGILNGTKYKDQCSQIYRTTEENKPSGPVGSEDCLYLNIFTPKKIIELKGSKNHELLPVIVYIHGGIQSGNGSRYGHDYFLDEDVVLVLIHFRIHVYANLNTEDGATSGNLGLKDQVLALKWIRKHISKFGGDPKKVTIYGNSSGSMHVSAHLISPMSKGLFHRAIMQSGTILNHGIFTRHPKKVAFELGEKLGCGKNTSSFELLSCLRKIDTNTLTLASKLMSFDFSIEPNTLENFGEKCVPESPVSLLKSGKINQVPLMQGDTSAEGLITSLAVLRDLRDEKLIFNHKRDWNLFFKKYLAMENVRNATHLFDKFHKFYFNSSKSLGVKDLDALINLFSDREYFHPLIYYLRSEYFYFKNTTPIYLYYFTKAPQRSFAEIGLKDLKIKRIDLVRHADDLMYFFPAKNYERILKGSKSYELSKSLIKKYINFAKHGDPNGIARTDSISNSTENEIWQPFKSDNTKNWLEIGDDFKMIDPLFNSRMKLWDLIDPYELYF